MKVNLLDIFNHHNFKISRVTSELRKSIYNVINDLCGSSPSRDHDSDITNIVKQLIKRQKSEEKQGDVCLGREEIFKFNIYFLYS